MCGIAGFVGVGGLEDIRRMNLAQASRGPDADNIWSDQEQGIYLGHRRLSILDIGGGAQPMWTRDGTLGIVFNGEIYNHAELREELKKLGQVFISDHSDTEVLLLGYRVWGESLTERLNGMWAFVLFDRENHRLFCSRDRFGKKPFYYTLLPNLFAFASELTALTAHSAIQPTVSRLALKKYFAYGYIPAPLSIYDNIYKLPAGHSLNFDLKTQKINIYNYWEFVIEPFETVPAHPEKVWGEELRDLLGKAVKRRLISDVPIGAFLSGGIDSSAVSAFAARELGEGKLNTFSIGFDEVSFDESEYASAAAKHLKTDHHLEWLSLEKAKELLPQVAGRLDEPMGDSSLLPTYLLCGYARKHVTVALGGDGADELFAGYDPFRALKWAKLYADWVPKPMHQAMQLMIARFPVSHRNMSLDFKIKRTLRGLSFSPRYWSPIWMAPLSPEELEEMFQEPVDLDEVYSEVIVQWEACPQDNLIDKTLQFYTKLYLQDDILTKVDRASMMHSLEIRAPFLDIDLVNFVRRIPAEYKFHKGESKYLLKRALEEVLPKSILYRPKKGFAVPIGKWFHQGKISVAGIAEQAHVEPDFITRAIDDHRKNKTDHRALLWNLFLLYTALNGQNTSV
jgi:asparagine synthase (glutamine-hydrolysing)